MEQVLRTPELPAKRGRRKARDLYSGLTVLRTESKDDQAKLLADVSQYIGPTNPIESVYVQDWVSHEWDARRYRRISTDLLNNALKRAVEQILHQILFPVATNIPRLVDKWFAIEDLSYQWLFDKEVRRRVSSMVREAGLNESAIEAKAFTLAADDLQKVNRLRMSAEAARDKALHSIAELRNGLAKKLQRYSDQAMAANQTPSIANDEKN
jgi:hypothetical protein